MDERYEDDEGGWADERLDEYLCEYVDGSMDPAVKASFEEYLQQNPSMAEHARRLMATRRLLCQSHRCAHAPRDLQHRLQIEIARDLMGASTHREMVGGLGRFATLTSAFGMAVLLGALVGASMVQRRVPVMSGPIAGQWDDQVGVPSDAHGHTTRLTHGTIRTAGFGVLGPATAMPGFASSPSMTPIGGTDSLSASALRRTHAAP